MAQKPSASVSVRGSTATGRVHDVLLPIYARLEEMKKSQDPMYVKPPTAYLTDQEMTRHACDMHDDYKRNHRRRLADLRTQYRRPPLETRKIYADAEAAMVTRLYRAPDTPSVLKQILSSTAPTPTTHIASQNGKFTSSTASTQHSKNAKASAKLPTWVTVNSMNATSSSTAATGDGGGGAKSPTAKTNAFKPPVYTPTFANDDPNNVVGEIPQPERPTRTPPANLLSTNGDLLEPCSPTRVETEWIEEMASTSSPSPFAATFNSTMGTTTSASCSSPKSLKTMIVQRDTRELRAMTRPHRGHCMIPDMLGSQLPQYESDADPHLYHYWRKRVLFREEVQMRWKRYVRNRQARIEDTGRRIERQREKHPYYAPVDMLAYRRLPRFEAEDRILLQMQEHDARKDIKVQMLDERNEVKESPVPARPPPGPDPRNGDQGTTEPDSKGHNHDPDKSDDDGDDDDDDDRRSESSVSSASSRSSSTSSSESSPSTTVSSPKK